MKRLATPLTQGLDGSETMMSHGADERASQAFASSNTKWLRSSVHKRRIALAELLRAVDHAPLDLDRVDPLQRGRRRASVADW